MIRAGDSIENPVTGERLVFKKTSAETNGEYVLFDCIVKPSGFVAAAHVHPHQLERFEVLDGSLTFKVDGQELPTEAGDIVLVTAGRKHQFWNAGEEEARFECEVRPPLDFEQLIETMFSLAQAGKTNPAAETEAQVCLGRVRDRPLHPVRSARWAATSRRPRQVRRPS